MTIIFGDITMSVDGFVTGPGADPEHGLGLDADGLHAWALDSDDPVDRGVLARHTAGSGAVIMGRKTFDTVDGPHGPAGHRRGVGRVRSVAGISIPDAARELLESDAVAQVVTLNKDGSPQVTAAWVGVEGDEIVLGTIPDQRKLRNLRRDPRIALSVPTKRVNDWGLLEYLVIYGTARVEEGGAPELLQRLAHTYLGPDVLFPPMPNPPPGFVTRVTPERLGGVGPWNPPPA